MVFNPDFQNRIGINNDIEGTKLVNNGEMRLRVQTAQHRDRAALNICFSSYFVVFCYIGIKSSEENLCKIRFPV